MVWSITVLMYRKTLKLLQPITQSSLNLHDQLYRLLNSLYIQRLDGARFIAIVESAGDLAAGKVERRLFAFGDRPLEERLIFLYPTAAEPLELARDQVGDWAELLSLIANPAEWAVTAVYAAQGRFAADGERMQPTRHEPVAVVSVESAAPGAPAMDPVAIVR